MIANYMIFSILHLSSCHQRQISGSMKNPFESNSEMTTFAAF